MAWKPNYVVSDKLISAMRQIGEAIGELRGLHLAGNVLARLALEARALSTHASTSIEGNPLPLTDVKRLLKSAPAHIRDTEREVLNYSEALKKIHADVKSGRFRPDVKTLESIQGRVVAGLMDNPADVGHLRRKPVVIRDPRRPDAIVFMPPDIKDVPRLTRDLMDFVAAGLGRIDPILLAGLFHRQFVIIHPFVDGNGRTARLFTTALLGRGGLDLFEILSFESYYNRNITRYFTAVGLRGDYYDLKEAIDFTGWLEYFTEGILDELRRVWKSIPASTQTPRLEAHHRQILAYIGAHGSITQREYGRISNRSLAARKNDFQKLAGLGLIETRGGGRSLYYVLPEPSIFRGA